MKKKPLPENIPVLNDVVSTGSTESLSLSPAQLAHLEHVIQTAVTTAMQQSTQELAAHLEHVLPQLIKDTLTKN
jgi:hypothetical protein